MTVEPAGTMIYEGKAKKIFTTDRPDQVLQYFKDDATAFNAQKRGTIVDKGVVNNKVSERLFRLLDPAIIEFYYKDDALGDPLVNDDHLRLLNVATPAVLREMRELGHKINAVLLPFFKERRMMLVDFKLEFGVFHNRLILADEISPDTCRFWDQTTKESMDKDRFRKDLGKIEEAYQEVLKRVCE